MKRPPCKTCLPGVPRHIRQRIVIRNGKRVQVCERCGKIVFKLDKLQPDELRALEPVPSEKEVA